MGRVWVASLRGCGLDGVLPHAWQVQGAAAAGEYLGKWGAAEELALADRKQGKRAGLTPWQLLAASRDGDALASVKGRSSPRRSKARGSSSGRRA